MGSNDAAPAATRGDGTGPGPGGPRYRGADRRGLIACDEPIGDLLARAATVVGVLVIAMMLVALRAELADTSATQVTAQLQGAALAAGLTAAVLCFARWRLVGEAAALPLSLASATFALTVLGPHVAFDDAAVGSQLGATQASGRLVTAILVVLALSAPVVDARLRPRWLIPTTMAVLAASSVAFLSLPAMASHLLGHFEEVELGAADPSGAPIVVAAWVLLAVGAAARALQRHQPLLGWFGLGLLLLAGAQSVGFIPDVTASHAGLVTALFQTAGLVCVGVGAGWELSRAFRAQDGRLLASMSSVRSVEAQAEADHQAREERAHEARNVLLAIEAATATLERCRDQLGPDDRAVLSASITDGVERLQRLVDVAPPTEPIVRFRPSEVLPPLVTIAGAHGAELHVDVPVHLVAIGRPIATGQVLHNLIENARHYGGREISVRATLEHQQVVVRVSDTGAGVPTQDRDRIFERGARGSTSDGVTGSGLGLHISRELMRSQDGELNLGATGPPGATFEVRLPGWSTLLGEPPVGHVEDGRASTGRQRLRLVSASAPPATVPREADGSVEEQEHPRPSAAR